MVQPAWEDFYSIVADTTSRYIELFQLWHKLADGQRKSLGNSLATESESDESGELDDDKDQRHQWFLGYSSSPDIGIEGQTREIGSVDGQQSQLAQIEIVGNCVIGAYT